MSLETAYHNNLLIQKSHYSFVAHNWIAFKGVDFFCKSECILKQFQKC